MHQSTVAFKRISCPMCSRSSLLESGTLFLRVLASGSSCSGCLGVAYEFENWILRETTFFVGAMLGTTVDTCSASVLWWPWKTVHFLRGGRLVSLSVTSPFGLTGEVCQSMLRLQFGFARFALGNTGRTFTSFTWFSCVMTDRVFRCSVRHFSASSSELRPCQSDCGAVDIHAFIAVS